MIIRWLFVDNFFCFFLVFTSVHCANPVYTTTHAKSQKGILHALVCQKSVRSYCEEINYGSIFEKGNWKNCIWFIRFFEKELGVDRKSAKKLRLRDMKEVLRKRNEMDSWVKVIENDKGEEE